MDEVSFGSSRTRSDYHAAALAGETLDQLRSAFQSLSISRETSVAILRSGNEKLFCGGVDLRDAALR
jgi:enoyl-CoA hydratase/carnithine racemase